MRVLVTRPEPDGLKLKGLIEQRGHEADVEPLLSVRFDDCDPVELDGDDNVGRDQPQCPARRPRRHPGRAGPGLDGLCRRRRPRRRRRGGWGSARSSRGPGTAAGLLQIDRLNARSDRGDAAASAGRQVAVDIRGELEALGFRVGEAVVYRMRAAATLSPEIREQVERRRDRGRHAHVAANGRDLCPPDARAPVAVAGTVDDAPMPLRGGGCAPEAARQVPVEVAEAPSVEEMLALVDLAAAKLEF